MVLETLDKTVRSDIFLEIATASAESMGFRHDHRKARELLNLGGESHFNNLSFEQYAEEGIKESKVEKYMFLKESRIYRLHHKHDCKHTRSCSGYAQDISTLTDEDSDKLILEQHDYNSWITMSGDFEDYPNKSEHFVKLHEEDELGRMIFEAIREFRKTKNWSGVIK